MIPYSKYPFLRLLIALVGGIVLFEFIRIEFSGFLIILFLLPVLPVVWFLPQSHKLKTMVPRGMLIQLFVLIFGYFMASHKNYRMDVPDLSTADAVVCRITQTPVKKTRSFKSEAVIQSAKLNGNWVDIDQKIIIYSPLNENALWKYDDIVLLRSTIQFPKAPANPHQFNYKNYLAKNGIYYQSYVKKSECLVLGHDERFTLMDMAEHSVQYARKVLYKMIPDEDLAAVATALLVGYQEELDPETKTSFSRVGAMHILAVSGLHVGVIFLLLSRLLFPLNRNKTTKFIKAILLISFLWCYALIAGFSPSIVRAALMFTLLIPIISFHVMGNAYNNIASSAFLLLLYNPNYLFDVGFLLSYVAVFGIILLYPYLNRWVKTDVWIVRNIWQLTAVSLAATIFTTPIVLYYFGQFPLSFLISNIIAVPLSTFILYLGILALVVVHIPGLSWLLSKILYGSLWLLREAVEWIEALPFSYVDHLLINRWQVYLMYAMLTLIISYFIYRKQKAFTWTLLLLCIFVMTLIVRRYEVLQHRELYIYHMNKTSYVELVDGHYAVNVLQQELTDMEFGLFIRSNHQAEGVFWKVNRHSGVMVNGNAFQVGKWRFYRAVGYIPTALKPLEVDYLILSEMKYLDVDQMNRSFRFKEVILLNNHSPKRLAKYKELLTDAEIPFYAVADMGCFKLDIDNEPVKFY